MIELDQPTFFLNQLPGANPKFDIDQFQLSKLAGLWTQNGECSSYNFNQKLNFNTSQRDHFLTQKNSHYYDKGETQLNYDSQTFIDDGKLKME